MSMSQHLSFFTANIWKLYYRRWKLKWHMLPDLTIVLSHIYIHEVITLYTLKLHNVMSIISQQN